MVRCKSLLGAVAVVLMVSLVSAQDQPRRGGFGGRGGGGMFGGPSALLRMPEVRKELATTDEQNKEIDAVLEQAGPPGGGFGNFQNLSDEERQKAREEMRKKGEETDAKIKKILKPEQVTRLDQLALQRQGADALMRPEVAKQLTLTDEQKGKLEKIQEEARAPRGGPGGGAGGGGFQNLSDEERQKLFAEMQKRREKTQADMVAVLTDEQKTKWAEMNGKKFDFPAFGGFGGPGGGGRPGGAGGERRRPPTKE